MLAVISTGGNQYLIKTGSTLKVEKLDLETGESAVFKDVLLTANDDGSDVKIGMPTVAGIEVSGKVLKQGKNRTLRVEKFKRKVRYHKVHGQRQRYTEVQIV